MASPRPLALKGDVRILTENPHVHVPRLTLLLQQKFSRLIASFCRLNSKANSAHGKFFNPYLCKIALLFTQKGNCFDQDILQKINCKIKGLRVFHITNKMEWYNIYEPYVQINFVYMVLAFLR
jgi:hypothetical protein